MRTTLAHQIGARSTHAGTTDPLTRSTCVRSRDRSPARSSTSVVSEGHPVDPQRCGHLTRVLAGRFSRRGALPATLNRRCNRATSPTPARRKPIAARDALGKGAPATVASRATATPGWFAARAASRFRVARAPASPRTSASRRERHRSALDLLRTGATRPRAAWSQSLLPSDSESPRTHRPVHIQPATPYSSMAGHSPAPCTPQRSIQVLVKTYCPVGG
jgi:hypothetical protein